MNPLATALRPDRFCNARILDLDTGELGLPQTIEVSADGRIIRITEQRTAGHGDVDLAGMTVLPGLFDAHVHLSPKFPFSEIDPDEDPAQTALRAASHARDALYAGFTTIRCVHEQNAVDIAIKHAARDGWLEAPRIVGAGRAVSTTGGHGHGFAPTYADGADGFLRACRNELASGADIIKIYITGGLADVDEGFDVPKMTGEEIRAAVTAAAEHHSYVVAHAGSSAAIREAIAQGVRSFEHGYSIDAGTAKLMADTQCVLTPTLSVTTLGDWMLEQGFDKESVASSLEANLHHRASLRNAIAAGVTIASGSDVAPGMPCDGTVCGVIEIELLQQAGLSPLEALRSATVVAADLCRVSAEVGRVSVGLMADLVAMPGNPASDISALRGIRTVVQAGRVVRHDRLAHTAMASPAPAQTN
ncbi:peptidase M38 [Mycolicibacterium murale]|uniref:Peptidase M38 n=1 Tax=Mycolicibacterium murale TaxID=182220 RepID=A0A7I9WLU7_9MYCO|nr:amidohydrolase family protein [Mycolicibacterium murale]MCV7180420.1 amidohydrolase family protein [Mycolicibacterium murale]GFG58711.1 peptidase M38 [Mycolicibacterium murale]